MTIISNRNKVFFLRKEELNGCVRKGACGYIITVTQVDHKGSAVIAEVGLWLGGCEYLIIVTM